MNDSARGPSRVMVAENSTRSFIHHSSHDARRYMFGWLGKDDIAVLNTRGTTALATVNAANRQKGAGAATPAAPVAAVIPDLGLWFEWRDGMDTSAPGCVVRVVV